MTTKINPGCNFPEIKLPPSLIDFYTNLLTKTTAKVVETKLVRDARNAAQAAAAKKKEIDAYEKRLEKYQKLATQFLQIQCPLPPVTDKVATDVEDL